MRAVQLAVAGALATGLWALPVVPATAAGGQGGALGTDSLVIRVDAAARTDDALRLVLTLRNPGPEQRQLLYVAPTYGTFSGVGAIDPQTGRYGSIHHTAECRCDKVPNFLDSGEEVTFTVDVPDPGGAVVDVVFTAFQPVTGVPVTGRAGSAAQGVVQLEPRSMALPGRSASLQSRALEGAVRTQGEQVALATDVLFALDSSALSPAAGAELDRAATALRALPGRRLTVQGHTDSQGDTAYNQTLSEQRAQAVRDGLAARLGEGWTYEVQGLGETRPVASEMTPEGKPDPDGQARNRRVELRAQT